jgi:hypothetical protein
MKEKNMKYKENKITVRELFGHFVLATEFCLMKNEPILGNDINDIYKYIYEEGTVGEWYAYGENYGDWFVDSVYINHLTEQMVVGIYKEEK